LTCQGRGVTATGKDASEGFVVLSGSSAATVETESLAEWFPGASALRKDLLKSGILAANGPALQFTQDYVFSSPSYASSVILGRTSNGRTDWKDATGRTLKELQESKTEVSGDIHASVGGTVVTSELD
jgi:hypothetical protein